MRVSDNYIFERLDKLPRSRFRYGVISVIIFLGGLIYLLFGVELTTNKPNDTISLGAIRLDSICQVVLLLKINSPDNSFLKTGSELAVQFGSGNINQRVDGFVKREIQEQNGFSAIEIALKGEITATPVQNNDKFEKSSISIFRYLIENLHN